MADRSAAKWMVDRARQSLLKKDPFEAKTWLITAKTLFPEDFCILYEAYVIEQNSRKAADSAKMFYEMFEKFPDKSLIWEEVVDITEALEGSDLDLRQEFLKDMFGCLPKIAQREILLKAAGQCRDCIEKCRMMLLLMKHFPDVIPKNGVALIEMLTDAEELEYKKTPINPYRKLLVCDVLPHLLASDSLTVVDNAENQFGEETQPRITQGRVYKWLELAIQFYTSCATHQTSSHNLPLMSPETATNSDKEIIDSVHDGEGPWTKLYYLFCLTSHKCEWLQVTQILDKLDVQVHRNSKVRWACLADLHHKLKKTGKQSFQEGCQFEQAEKGGVFYATLILFLHTVWEYCKAVNKLDSNAFAGSCYPLILLEDIASENQSASPEDSPVPKKKKKKTTGPGSPSKDDKNRNPPSIVIAKSCGIISSSLADEFVVAVDAWHLLNTHSNYKTDFLRLLKEWCVSDWTWMDSFKVDRLVYKNKYKKVIELLKELEKELDASVNPGALVRARLQLSCCYFSIGEYKAACTEALDALQCFSSHSSPAPGSEVWSPLKRSASAASTPHASARDLGADKPTVAGPGSTDIDILEEFAYLYSEGNVKLDLLQKTPTGQRGRTVTRGVNKGAKEDFRAAMERQVARVDESIEALIKSFLLEERDTLLP